LVARRLRALRPELAQELVDDVLIGLEDRDFHDLIALHAVDIGALDLHRRPVAMKALSHEQCHSRMAAGSSTTL
jgi:hypothetical protein